MYEFIPHTADIRMRAEALSLQGLFSEALAGLADVLGGGPVPPQRDRAAAKETVALTADSSTNLLIDFLNEALYFANVNKAVYDRVRLSSFGETHLSGTLEGFHVDGFAQDVKAVTYHGAQIAKNSRGQFSVELVFDI